MRWRLFHKTSDRRGGHVSDCLLRIVVSEKVDDERFSYRHILEQLWNAGVPGATVRRCTMDIDGSAVMHSEMVEDAAFDALALTFEAVVERNLGIRLAGQLADSGGEGQVTVLDGIEGPSHFDAGRSYAVKVFTKETSVPFRKAPHQKIMDFLQEHGITWATATRGIVGYGHDRVVHEQKMFSLSRNTPMIIEFVTTGDHLGELLKQLDDLVVEGAILTMPVAVTYRG